MLHLFYFQLAALYKAWNEVKKKKKKNKHADFRNSLLKK